MRPLIAFAWYTICKALHHAIALALSIIVGTFFVGNFLGNYLIGSYEKILVNCAFFSFQLFILLLNIFFVIPFFERQKELLTQALSLGKNLTTSHLFYGVSLGFFCSSCGFGIIFFSLGMVILKCLTGQWLFHLLLGFLALSLEGIVLISIALFFSSLLPQILCYAVTFTVYALCYTNHSYYLLPDLRLVDIQSHIIHQLPINAIELSLSGLYLFIFSMLFLLGGNYLFQRKFDISNNNF